MREKRNTFDPATKEVKKFDKKQTSKLRQNVPHRIVKLYLNYSILFSGYVFYRLEYNSVIPPLVSRIPCKLEVNYTLLLERRIKSNDVVSKYVNNSTMFSGRNYAKDERGR